LSPSGSWCAALRGIDPLGIKMTKSLYDAPSTRNLRDLIIGASTVRAQESSYSHALQAPPCASRRNTRFALFSCSS
jgi:hypothetical protein